MIPLPLLLQQFAVRYRTALMTKAAVLTGLGLGCCGLLAWRLTTLHLEPHWRLGFPLALAAGLLAAEGWWLHRQWMDRRHAAAFLDRTLKLKQGLITAEEFSRSPNASPLYPVLVEELAHQLSTDRIRLPRPWDHKSGLLIVAILLLLLWPRLNPVLPPALRQPEKQQTANSTPPSGGRQQTAQNQSQNQSQQTGQGNQQQSAGGGGQQPSQAGGQNQQTAHPRPGADSTPPSGGRQQTAQNQSQNQSQQTGQGNQQQSAGGGGRQPSQAGGQNQQTADSKQQTAQDQNQQTERGKGSQQSANGSQQSAQSQNQQSAHNTQQTVQNQQTGQGNQQQAARGKGQQQQSLQGQQMSSQQHQESPMARDGSGSQGTGQSLGEGAALKADIQQLLKEMSGELKNLQAQLEASRDQAQPTAGTSTDPNLYGDAEKLEDVRTKNPLPLQLQTDSAATKGGRPGVSIGKPSGDVSAATPNVQAQDAQLADQPLDESAAARQPVPAEYRSVFDQLQRREAQPGGQQR